MKDTNFWINEIEQFQTLVGLRCALYLITDKYGSGPWHDLAHEWMGEARALGNMVQRMKNG